MDDYWEFVTLHQNIVASHMAALVGKWVFPDGCGMYRGFVSKVKSVQLLRSEGELYTFLICCAVEESNGRF